MTIAELLFIVCLAPISAWYAVAVTRMTLNLLMFWRQRRADRLLMRHIERSHRQ